MLTKPEIKIPLCKNEIEILINALNYLEYEFGFDDSPEEPLKEKLICFFENGFNNNFNS